MNDPNATCRQPPALSNEVLFALVDFTGGATTRLAGALLPSTDSEVAAQVAAHLRLCPYCNTRLAHIRRFVTNLQRAVYRVGCPDPQTLARLAFGQLLPADAEQVQSHLAECFSCQAEWMALQALVDDAGAADAAKSGPSSSTTVSGSEGIADSEGITDIEGLEGIKGVRGLGRRIHRAVGRVIAVLSPLTPDLVLRGADSHRRFTAQAGDVTVFIEVEATDVGVRVRGQILAGSETAWQPALVEARREGKLLSACFVDEVAEFQTAHFTGHFANGLIDLVLVPASGPQLLIPGVPLGVA